MCRNLVSKSIVRCTPKEVIQIIRFKSIALEGDRTTHYIDGLRDQVANGQYNIVLCVLRAHRNDTYNAIKRETLCKDASIISQVFFFLG